MDTKKITGSNVKFTTKEQATMLYEIAHYIDPFAMSESDREEYITNFMSNTMESNLDDLNEFIFEGYDTKDLLRDTELMRMYLKLHDTM